MCIAAPVFGSEGNIVCALSITFPSYIYTDRGIEAEVAAVLRHVAVISGNV
jgi:DNA-binding IclR family transcriptional regulator